MPNTYTCELLASHHDRAAFSCGVESLDTYIRQYARQDMERDLAMCYVLCEPGNSEIAGYYTLSAFAVDLLSLPSSVAKKSGVYERVPALLLGRLAVASAYRGQQMGRFLLMNALRRTLDVPVGRKLVVVDALDDAATAFYEHYGFVRFADNPLRLYLQMAQVRKLFPGAAGAGA